MDNAESKPLKGQDKNTISRRNKEQLDNYASIKMQKNENDTVDSGSSGGKNKHGKPISKSIIPKYNRPMRRVIVPRVPSTDYIPSNSLHIEGLFAGYRPLFLGNSASPVDGSENYYDMGNNLSPLEKKENKKLVVPWNVSISGIKFHEHNSGISSNIEEDPFQNIPDKLLYTLSPFKLYLDDADLWVNRDSNKYSKGKRNPNNDNNNSNSGNINSGVISSYGKKRKKNEMVVLKFHNSKIDDRPEFVDLYNMKEQSHYNENTNLISYSSHNNYNYKQYYGEINQRNMKFRKQLKKTQKLYNDELQSLAYEFGFIRNDQIKFRNNILSLSELLIDKFEELTGLKIQLHSQENRLPIYIYFQLNLVTKRRLRSIISNSINLQTGPILSSLLPNFETHSQANYYHERFKKDVKKVTSNLLEVIPSLLFVDTGKSVDCVYQRSPIPGFKRIYWLNPNNKRLRMMNKKIGSTILIGNKMRRNFLSIRKTGTRFSEPITLQGRTISGVFKEWDYYTN